MPALASSPTWRVSQPTIAELREPLLKLWHRNLPDASRDRFEWLYGSGRAEALVLGERSIIGAAGLMRRRFAIDGELVEAGAAIDLNVDESQRSVGPAMTLARAVLKLADDNGCSVVYGFPIAKAAGVLKRCGYRQVGVVSNWTKLLRCETKLRGVLRSSLAAKVAAPVADFVLRWKSSSAEPRLPSDITVHNGVEFDARFDRLWERVSQRGGVIGERSANFLNWRFAKCPELKYECFTLARRGSNELLGYVVWYRSNESLCIADLIGVDPSTTRLLVAEFTRFARRQKADAIRLACLASSAIYTQLESSGFSRRQDSYPVLVRMPEFTGDILLTMADHDTDV